MKTVVGVRILSRRVVPIGPVASIPYLMPSVADPSASVRSHPHRPVGDAHTEPSVLASLMSAAEWTIDPEVTFLNHGSYGVVPQAVRREQQRLRDLMDNEPVLWFNQHLEQLMDRTRAAVGELLNCSGSDLAPVPNGTYAVATVLHSLDLGPGDEVLITSHEYDATRNELRRLSSQRGFAVAEAKVPFPIRSPDEAYEAVASAIRPSTRVLIVSHLTSATGLLMPVERLVKLARERGVEILVDGAHGPGQVPIDLTSLDPDYYAASCHKWVCSPKGTAFFYARKDKQSRIQPLAMSCRTHNTRDDRAGFLCNFDYVGTGDSTGNLSIPAAITHLNAQRPGGLAQVRQENHDLIVRARKLICDRLGISEPAPESMIGSMASIPLPKTPHWREPKQHSHAVQGPYGDPLWNALAVKHRVQVPVWSHEPTGTRVIRISAHLHNSIEQYERLANALAEELGL